MKRFTKLLVVFALVLALVVPCIATADPAAAATPKRAIYVLPGYLGSQIYAPKATSPIWLGAPIITDVLSNVLLRKTSPMANNSSGTGMKGVVNKDRDLYGTLNQYETLVKSLQALVKSRSMNYDVVFFPYNWVGDINDSAKALEDDIKKNKYEKVIFVTHSNGGLLTAAFLARNKTNKNLVEKAVLIAAPALGAPKAIMCAEDNLNMFYTGSFESFLNQATFSLTLPLYYSWLKSWTSNSPNLYQLYPGKEYMAYEKPLYKTSLLAASKPVTDVNEFYKIMAKSSSANKTLVSGNNRSGKYFRSTTLKDDIYSVLGQVDVVMVAGEYGLVTPQNVVYTAVGSKAILTDVIYSKEGDGTVPVISSDGRGRFPCVMFRNLGHGELVENQTVLNTVNSIISGTFNYKASNVRMPGMAAAPSTLSIQDDGMADFMKVQLKSSEGDVGVLVYDDRGNVVAGADENGIFGFEENEEFVFASLPGGNGVNEIIYVPNDGYTVEFIGESSDNTGDTTIIVSSLTEEGDYDTQTTYEVTETDDEGVIADIEADGTVSQPAAGDDNIEYVSEKVYR